ncbi:MAG: hypothetical protein WDO15_11575 [Bacteroidota bacterium]
MKFLKLFVNLFHFNRTNWKAVALCFITASIFWLFNALNKTYSTSIRFPLQFEFDHDKFAPVGQLPQSLLINVKGTGWDLFRKYFGVKVPTLTIPIERPAETRKIVGSTLPPRLSSQMGSIQINHVVVDTVRLHIEPRIFRKFPLVVDTTRLNFTGDLNRISRVSITPDSVDISGPVSIIHNTPDPIVLKLTDNRIDGNFREEIEVEIADEDFVQRNPPVVEVKFEVGEVVLARQIIRLEHSNLPWGYVTQQDSIQCTFRIPQKYFGKFTASELYGTLPVIGKDELIRGTSGTYTPIVHGLPQFAEIISVDSVKVKHF